MGWLWVVFTVVAAGGQVTRNALQRELTTTLGMRRSERQRHVADRREVVVDVAGQPVRVKMRSRGGVELGAKAEHDDCVRAAAACGMSPIEVARRAVDAATTQAIGLA